MQLLGQNPVASVIRFAVFLFFVILLGRLVLDWVQAFARDWRPRGPLLVVAEFVYTITDPPLKALRRVIPPLTLGTLRLDLAFLVLMFGDLSSDEHPLVGAASSRLADDPDSGMLDPHCLDSYCSTCTAHASQPR